MKVLIIGGGIGGLCLAQGLLKAGISVPMVRPRWKDLPSWYLIAEQDRMIPQLTQQFMAERMKARIHSYPVDHTPSVTAPYRVTELIIEAVRATES